MDLDHAFDPNPLVQSSKPKDVFRLQTANITRSEVHISGGVVK